MASAGARGKTGVLGAKKPQKIGAKKVVANDIDFDAAEKKAKEEAERIAKLGYDPDAEAAEEVVTTRKTSIVSPTPISPKATNARSVETEKVTQSMGRLGFGQTARTAPAPTQAKKMGGFGSTGSRAEGMASSFQKKVTLCTR